MQRQNIIVFDEPTMGYTKGYKYQLSSDLGVFIPALAECNNFQSWFIDLTDGYLLIRKGWAYDGPSGPTIDTRSSMRGAAVHDALYYAIRQGLLPARAKDLADELLHDICLIDEMWHWRANSWYVAVDRFANAAADPRNKKQIHTAGKGRGDLLPDRLAWAGGAA